MSRRMKQSALFVLLLFVTPTFASDEQPHLTICNILSDPSSYQDREVTVRGTYRVAFEASALYCLSCLNSGRVWVEFENSDAGSEEIVPPVVET